MKKILIVDDEKDFCFFVKANLELSSEYKVTVATNGKEGIRAAETHQPDLILLDVMMPGMDGIDVLKILKENKRTIDIPVLMLTAKGDEETKMQAATSYNEGYIVKPVAINDLKGKIEEALSRFGK
ncbi:MAG: response regulator [Candidatus Omnitrophica bacterium]|nr:response regulator [Candidatus Omnitrophota bacterium]